MSWSSSGLYCTAETWHKAAAGFSKVCKSPWFSARCPDSIGGDNLKECFHFSELHNNAGKKNNPESEKKRELWWCFSGSITREHVVPDGARVVGVVWQKGRHNSNLLLVWATTWKCCSTWSAHYRRPGLSLMRRLCSTTLLTGTSAWKEASGSVESVWHRRSYASGLLTWRMYRAL